MAGLMALAALLLLSAPASAHGAHHAHPPQPMGVEAGATLRAEGGGGHAPCAGAVVAAPAGDAALAHAPALFVRATTGSSDDAACLAMTEGSPCCGRVHCHGSVAPMPVPQISRHAFSRAVMYFAPAIPTLGGISMPPPVPPPLSAA